MYRTVSRGITKLTRLRDGQPGVFSAGAKKPNNDSCAMDQEQHKATRVPKIMVPNTAELQKQLETPSTRKAEHSLDGPSSRQLGRLPLKDFLTLKTGVKTPSPEETVLISEMDTCAQIKSRAMKDVSEASMDESMRSRLSGESCFQADLRVTMLSKRGFSRKRQARSIPESGLLIPESEFQAGLRVKMQAKREGKGVKPGASIPGSVSLSRSEESNF